MSLPYSRQSIGAAEVAAVAHAVGDALLTGGPTLARFEARLAETVGAQHAIAVSSGTAALHVAYLAAGVGPRTRVLTAPLTFVATANAAIHCGATVAFADVDERGSLDPLAVANAEPAPFVVPVHYAGHPAQLEGIAEAAPSAVFIEDACHALGAMYRDRDGTWRRVGDCAHSAMAVFSFHAVKTITTGEGGAIVTNDALLASRCRRLRDHGLERELDVPADPWGYELNELGFNYRLTDIQAALGAVQLDRLAEMAAARAVIARRYAEAFAETPSVRVMVPAHDTRSSWHLVPVRVPASRRRECWETLREQGIGVQVHYIPVHLQPFYRRLGSTPGDCPVAEQLYREELSLPCFPGMTDDDVRRVVAALTAVLGRTTARQDTTHAHHAS
jgi:UDP-4-amino-4,6-dideoxy-N-acetyl-beta-L-altrosamine transaminase